jgi:hypothetical protein
VAERVGFEPTSRCNREHALQACLIGHSSTSPRLYVNRYIPLIYSQAERVGFEPTSRYNREPLFESGTINHSDTSPNA